MSNIKNEIFKRVFRLSENRRMVRISPDPRYKSFLKRKNNIKNEINNNDILPRSCDRHRENCEKTKEVYMEEMKVEERPVTVDYSEVKTLHKKRKQTNPDEDEPPLKFLKNEIRTSFSTSSNHQSNIQQKYYKSPLRELISRIMTMNYDDDEAQAMVDVIAESSEYTITSETFDFDFFKLNRRTVQKLQAVFGIQCVQ